MPTRREQLTKRLTEEGAKVADYLASLPPAAWEQQVYTTGGLWRVREVLCHFVSTEETVVRYGRDIVNGGQGAPEGFVIDEYNETQVGGMADREPAGLIEQFKQSRAETVTMVQAMQEADFDRTGRHPWFGLAPLEEMLKLAYRHNMIHLRDVRKALETGAPVAHLDIRPPAETNSEGSNP